MEYAYTSEKLYTLPPSRTSSNSEYGANWSWIPGLMVALSVLAILAVTIYIAWIFCEKRRVSKCSIINGQDPNTPEIIQYGSGFERCNIV